MNVKLITMTFTFSIAHLLSICAIHSSQQPHYTSYNGALSQDVLPTMVGGKYILLLSAK
jgi:hypothetical protein